MKELLGLIRNIPNAARHKSLRWHLAYIARVVAYDVARYAKATARLVVWHAVTLAGYAVYQLREVWRWPRQQ